MSCHRARGTLLLAGLLALQSAVASAAAPATSAPPSPPATHAGTVLADLPAQVVRQGEFEYATGPAPDWVVRHTVAEAWPTDAPGGNARWRNWLLDDQVDRRPGRDAAFQERAIEARSTDLVGDAAKYAIEFNPLYQKLTLHRVAVRRNGVWTNRYEASRVSLARRESDFEEDMSDGEVTALVLLADVRPGDVVRIAYTVTGRNPILAGSQQDSFTFAWVDPILDREVRAIFGASTRLAQRTLNGAPAGKITPTAEGAILSASRQRSAAIRNEGSYPNWYIPYPILQFAPQRSWADVVAWALPLYPDGGALPAELEERLPEWSRIADPAARAFAVLRTVQRDVRYFGTELGDNTHRPALPATTWERRYGDCKDKAFLTATLLRRVGIEAEPALVSVRRGRGLLELLPSGADFDHVIVRARIANASYWLDPTLPEQHGSLAGNDVHDYGVALPVRAGIDALVPVSAPGKTSNAVDVAERFAPSADGATMDLTVRSEYRGQRAEAMRRRVQSEGTEELSRSFADFYRKRFPDVAVASALEVDDPADADRLVLTEHYLLKDPWTSKLGQVRQIDLYADAIAGDAVLPDTVERTAPLALSHPSIVRHATTLVLPAGWALVDPPVATKVQSPEMTYSRDTDANAERLVLTHRLEVLSDNVPTKNVDAYLRGVREVRDDMGTRISLRTREDSGEAERKARLKKLLRNAMDNKETP